MSEKRPTLFGHPREKNVTFLVDTSGSMYCRLDIVKQHLKELLQNISLDGGRKFNMIEFNSDVTQWADAMVQCAPETVKVAIDWINLLEAKTGTNTESAILAAYNDQECETIYMVTDGLPDSNSTDILDRVSYVCNGRPCHCIYLTGASVDKQATEFLQDLATETYGSFTIVTVTNHGSIDRITPVYSASHGAVPVIRTTEKKVYAGNQKQCSVTNTLDSLPATTIVSPAAQFVNPYCLPLVPPGGVVPAISPVVGPHPGVVIPNPGPPRVFTTEGGKVLRVPYLNYAFAQWYQPYLWSRYRTARSWLKLSDDLDGTLASVSKSPAAGAMMIDQQVLARRSEDGLYYRGKVKSQISTDRFLVEFTPCEKGDFNETTYQETFVFDIIHENDAYRHSVMKGDRVLAPTSDSRDIYAPGTVIDGQEGRENDKDIGYKELVVMLSNGETVSVAAGKALWIDQLLYDRASFELKLPSKVRKSIIDTVAKYPEDSLPGYPVSGSDRNPEEWELPRKYHVTGDDAIFDSTTGLVTHHEQFDNFSGVLKNMAQKSHRSREELERTIPGTNKTQADLDRRVSHQIAAHQQELGNDPISTDRLVENMRRSRSPTRRCASPQQPNTSEIDRDIELLESELNYKMKLREKALEQRRREIDDEIDHKIKERDALIAERKLVLRSPMESRLSRSRELAGYSNGSYSPERNHSQDRHYSTGRVRSSSPRGHEHRYHERESRQRSRSRSLSPQRSPREYGSIVRSRSRSLSAGRQKSVDFDTTLNRFHKYRYYDEEPYEEYWLDEEGRYRDDTAQLRNGRRVVTDKKNATKPPWKYWRSESPKGLRPHRHEPYNQTAVAEPLELRGIHQNVNGVTDWGSSHFTSVVPNGRTNYDRFVQTERSNPMKSVSFQANADTSLSRGGNLVTKDADRLLSKRRPTTPGVIHTKHPSYGTVNEHMEDFHRERVMSQMHRENNRPETRTYTNQVRAMGGKPMSMQSIHQQTTSKRPAGNSYQREVNSTSYKRQVDEINTQLRSQTPEQRRIISKSAQRAEREHLHAAKLQQQENDRARSAEMKRDRANIRDDKVTAQLLSDVARQQQRITA